MDFFLTVIYVVASVICVVLLALFLMFSFFCGYYFARGRRRKKRTVKSQYKKRNAFIRLFWDFPRALARDFYSRDPDCMDIHGLYMFCGEQGSGKTIAAIEFMRRALKKYPKIKIRSNIGIDFQHGKINGWQDIVGVHNGEIGQIDFIDEMQNWFASTDFKSFPVEMLEDPASDTAP